MKNFLIITLLLYAFSFVLRAFKRDARHAVISKRLLVSGFLAHLAALIYIIADTGHAPMANIYESLIFYSWTITLVSLIVIFRYDERKTELITIPLAIVALIFAFFKEMEGRPLTPILDTHWFEIHVISCFAAYALFTLAFSAALLFLIYKSRNVEEEVLINFQEIAARSIMWGFMLFSFSMFAGAIWGYLAWGAYWMWEPKIIWSFIVWFFYAGAMHAYYVKQWRGTGLSIATVLGFFIVIFTFLGVGLLMKSSHSF